MRAHDIVYTPVTNKMVQSNLYVICELTKMFIPIGVEDTASQVALAIINIFISLFGTLANGLVIMAYYRNPHLRSIQNTIFCLLAITDFSVTAFVVPVNVVEILAAVLGNPSCLINDTNTVLSMLFLQLSLVTIVILSLQCYITLAYPYHWRNIITKSRLIITIVFSFVLVSCLTFAVFWHIHFLMYGTPVIIFMTVATVVVTWCWTYKLVARHRKAIRTTQTPSTSQNISQRKILRSTITAFLIIASILGCYALNLFLFFSEVFLSGTQQVMWSIAMTLVYLNSLLNPCLVFWRSTSFRETLENMGIC